MVKRLKALGKSDDTQLAEAVRTAARQIWQAGLGAFAKAQAEGGKAFDKLVKEGTDLQKKTQRLTEGGSSNARGAAAKASGKVSKQTEGSWDKLEQIFEDRVSRSLSSLGVPTRKDVETLTRRVEELSKAVSALSGKTPLATKLRAKAATVKKAAQKTTAAKKVASKAPARKAIRKRAAEK